MIRSPRLNAWLKVRPLPVEALLMDIDGVLLNARQRLPGSRRLLETLATAALPYLLITNDGNHSVEEKAGRLNSAGLPIAPEDIISCGHAIQPLTLERKLTGQLFFVMGDTGHPCYAETAGLVVTRDVKQLNHCSGVIIGEDNYEWEPVINAVINYFIDHPEAPLIIPNPDQFYPDPKMTIHIAAGGVGRFMVRTLEIYGTRIAPIYLGKPYPPIFQLARERLAKMAGKSIPANKILMVGDNLASDIAGGRAMGYRTALLLTGVTSEASLESAAADQLPDRVFEGL